MVLTTWLDHFIYIQPGTWNAGARPVWPGRDRSCRGKTGLVGARPVRLGQNYKYVPKDVGINFENCLNFFWIRTGLAPARQSGTWNAGAKPVWWGPNLFGPHQTGLVGTKQVWLQQIFYQFSKLIPTSLGTYLKFCPKQTDLAPADRSGPHQPGLAPEFHVPGWQFPIPKFQRFIFILRLP